MNIINGESLTDEDRLSRDKRIIFICWLAYAAAYVGRLNFSASIVAVISDLGVTKADAGLVSSCFFFAYGAGQLVNGILSERYNSKLMIALSLFTSAVLNIFMALCGDISVMKYIWLLNGVVQSVLWSTLIKTISDLVSEEMMPKAILVMSTPHIVGTFFAYGFSALFVRFGKWQHMFILSAVVLSAAACIWLGLFGKSYKPVRKEKNREKRLSGVSALLLVPLVAACIGGIANGFVKDGVNTWVTSVLYEEFSVSQSFSILLTLLLPLISMIGAVLVKKLHEKISSHSVMNLLLFAISAGLCAGLVLALRIHSIIFIMLCFIGVSCLMAMVNNVITSVFPLDNRNLISSGFSAGLLNTFCYVGSTVTSYSLGAVSQRSGWSTAFVIMLVVCAAAAAVCAVSVMFVSRKRKS